MARRRTCLILAADAAAHLGTLGGMLAGVMGCGMIAEALAPLPAGIALTAAGFGAAAALGSRAAEMDERKEKA